MMKPLLLATLVLAAACSSTSAQPSRHPAPNEVVATVGSKSITLAEVDERALQQSTANFPSVRLAQALYDARRAAIDEIVATTLLDAEARARGVDRADIIEKEITGKVAPVLDVDVANWYQANQARVQGAPLDQVRAPIRAYLTQQRMEDAREAYVQTLKAKTPVRVMLEPPRIKVASTSAPAKGPAGAPVEIVEFSDFQCPYCLRAHATIDQVLAAYGDRIRFVYRHFPLPSHPNARPAAEASACAAEQDKFWPYHDRLFAQPSKLSDGDLKQHAAELGLDTARFNACLDSHKYKSVVDADMKEGDEAGVNATPTFFINGRVVSGALPFDSFKRIIDDELSLQKR
jgi:protein-disulfide isomerase